MPCDAYYGKYLTLNLQIQPAPVIRNTLNQITNRIALSLITLAIFL